VATTTVETVPRTTTSPATLPTVPPRTTVETQPGHDAERAFFDDFDDDSGEWGPEALNDDFVSGEIADGFLSFSQSASYIETLPEGQTGTPLVLWPSLLDEFAAAYTDLRIETALVMTRGASAGLVCGIQPDGDDPRYYAFTLSSSGVIAIQKFERDGSFGNVARVPATPADAPPALPDDPAFEYDPETLYTLTAECLLGEESSQLSLELDGEVMLTYEDTDDPISSGIAGVQYSESSLLNLVEGFEPFGVVFDTFSLIDLNAGTGAPSSPGAFDSRCVDETGDMTDDKGNPLPELDSMGTDLAQVDLASDGSVLTVVWELADEAPADASATERGRLEWSVNLYSGDGEVITISAVLERTELTAFVDSNLAVKDRVDVELVSLRATTVAVDVPLDEVDIPTEFEWDAHARLTGSEIDTCPGSSEPIAVP
jgi:hypothetical protein